MSVHCHWLPIDIWLQFQGICDGAGAVILASEKAVHEFGLKPLARLVGYSVVGVEPTVMGIGPAPAIEKLLNACGKQLGDIDLVEVMSSHDHITDP
jgi:acetyl-CoA acyltransferase 2